MMGISFSQCKGLLGSVAALRRSVQLILLPLAVLTCVSAAPLSQDLSQGLRYLTLKTLSAESYLVKNTEQARTLILDLRGQSAESTDISLLMNWLNARGKNNLPVLILLNEDTAPALVRTITDTEWPAVLSLAPEGVSFPVDIEVDTDSAADRKACAAIARGDALTSLISAKIAKDRLDEARLSKTYETNGRIAAKDLEEPKKQPTSPAAPESNAKVSDLVLARAYQIHRALIALHLLP